VSVDVVVDAIVNGDVNVHRLLARTR